MSEQGDQSSRGSTRMNADQAETRAPDRNVEAVVASLRERSARGLAKYGVTTERGDLTLVQWLQHLQEELLDAAIYVERVKGELQH